MSDSRQRLVHNSLTVKGYAQTTGRESGGSTSKVAVIAVICAMLSVVFAGCSTLGLSITPSCNENPLTAPGLPGGSSAGFGQQAVEPPATPGPA